jgi:HAD superfamily hydrolase (TIGR01509 family)
MAEWTALIFDVDGTLAETEELHRAAFNRAFAWAGLDVVWDRARYRDLLKVTGGKRRIVHYFMSEGRAGDAAIADRLHAAKNQFYAEQLSRGIEPRLGVVDVVSRAKAAGLKLGIATTTGRSNLDALLAAISLPRFDAIVTAEDVDALKPDPEVYRIALTRLAVPADSALAFEDSANGVAAAIGAGIRTVVTPSLYTDDQDFSGAAGIYPNLVGFDWTQQQQRTGRPMRVGPTHLPISHP